MPGDDWLQIQSGEALTSSHHSESNCATAHLRLTTRRVEGPDSALKSELNDASDLSRTGSLAFGVELRYGQRRTTPGGFIRGKTSSAIYSHPDIPRFLLLTTLLTIYFYPLDWAPIAF